MKGDAKEELLLLRKNAAHEITQNTWGAEKLDEERKTNNECWEAHEHLNAAVARVEDGLVERGEDARLVVLAMIANEHILLLGKPGTGKLMFLDHLRIVFRIYMNDGENWKKKTTSQKHLSIILNLVHRKISFGSSPCKTLRRDILPKTSHTFYNS